MKLNSKVKKVLASDRFHNCAYVYTDGIVINEKAQGVARGLAFETEIIHIIPFTEEVKFRISGKSHDDNQRIFKGRYVFHNPTLLIDGITRLEIYLGNTSDKMKEMGISCDTITLTTDSGMKISEDCFTFISSDIAFQNDRALSIMDWDTWEYKDRIIWHGAKPEHKEAA